MKQPKFIRKIKQRVNDILSAWSVAGFSCIYEIVIVPHYGSKKTLVERQLRKQQAITEILQKKYAYLINKHSCKLYKSPLCYSGENGPIWTFWWQGEQAMPPIVRICYQSLLRNAGTHPVHLITKENIDKYIEFPSHIMKKVRNGHITLTHFSDILRMCLLYQYGGLWMDATIS